MGKFLSAVVAVFFCAGAAHASLFSQLVIFGDSLSDNGNAYIATGGAEPAPPFYTAGRFTDGPDTAPAGTSGGLWDEVLANLLGEPAVTPFLAGGTNYAVGGAQVLADVPGPAGLTIPSLQSQLALYLTSTGGKADPNALYVLWGGANDLYSAVETPGETATEVVATETAAINTLTAEIELLTADGARNFLWLNLPQLATTPRGEADPLNAALSTASTDFATGVADGTAALNATLGPLGVKIADVDIYGLYQKIVANPAAYGYTNVTTPAQGNPLANPDQYLFWDFDSHPTTTGHLLIGETADAAVLTTFAPEPATWAFAAVGLLLLARARRRPASR